MADPRWRLLRGGSWYLVPHFCRAACRGSSHPGGRPGNRIGSVGFRVVCPLPAGHAIPLDETHD